MRIGDLQKAIDQGVEVVAKGGVRVVDAR
ncbi:MAG: hypothetical protein HW394_1445, partial [Acidobacteria bacterium]|nr:hypothetical protein [Acidobacteriota bacterium]